MNAVDHDTTPVHLSGARARAIRKGNPYRERDAGYERRRGQADVGPLREAAEEITRIEQELTNGLAEVVWTGPDAERFRGQWQSEMVPALQQIKNSVNELGDAADRNASEQQSTSSS